MDKNETLGATIRAKAKDRPGSLHRLAIESGISWATLNRKVAHTELFTLEELSKLAAVMDVSPSELAALHYFPKLDEAA